MVKKEVLLGGFTDHCMLRLEVGAEQSSISGRDLRKLNVWLLEEEEVCENLRTV